MDDIAEPIDGYIAPAQEHVEELVDFLDRWDRAAAAGDPLLRRHQPLDRGGLHHRLRAIAQAATKPRSRSRLRAASRTASPNPRLVALADDFLGRRGRMKAAIAKIGYGDFTEEAAPFRLKLD